MDRTVVAHRTLAVVGVGPRGVMVLDRLLARLESDQAGTGPWTLHLVDPHRVGSGRVWRPDQDPLLLMNTPAFFPTACAADNPGLRPSSVSASFDDWRRAHPDAAGGLEREDYPPRAVYGRYLEDTADALLAALRARPEVGDVVVHRAEAVALHPTDDGGARLTLRPCGPAGDARAGAGVEELTADAVVLCLGHQDAVLSAAQRRLAETARKSDVLHYRGPHLPAELDLDAVGAADTVLVRGMGLNAFDLQARLTEGRGGAFRPTGDGPGNALAYEPSGQEPHLHVMSRRGVPYFPKAQVDAFVPRRVRLEYLSDTAIADLLDRHGELDVAEHVWPLLHRDVMRHYYATLARVHPEALGGPVAAGRFLLELVGMFEDAGRGAPVTARHAEELLQGYAPERRLLDIRSWAAPFRDAVFASSAEHQGAVAELLGHACEEASAGEDSPFMQAVGALHAGRLRIKAWVARGLVSEVSRVRDVQGWLEPLVEGLASGPPLLRVEQMLALHRAGLLTWAGPSPQVDADAEAGVFRVRSPRVGAEDAVEPAVTEGTWLVEAMMPPNRVDAAAAPLIRQMLADGVAATGTWEDEEGAPRPSTGFDVTARPHRLRSAEGAVHERILVLGLQLSGMQWGTAIAAEAGADARDRALSLADADAAAQVLLRS